MKRFCYGLASVVLAVGVLAMLETPNAMAGKYGGLLASPKSVNFGDCSVTSGCTTLDTEIYFTNNLPPGGPNIFVGQVTITSGRNTQEGDFQQHPGTDQNCQDGSIPPGGYCTLGVAFRPYGDTTGHKSATFTWDYDTCGDPSCTFTVTVRASGTATS
jgi:hypothetical protein